MSSPLTAKRRKLNESSSNLSKPFVSPLKSSNPDRPPLKSNHNAANLPYQPSALAHTIKAADWDSHRPTHLSKTPAKSAPIRKHPAFVSTSKRSNPAEIAAQRTVTSLELQIRNVRNDIDTLKQAAQITSSTTDADLEELATKWKYATQAAAEEVFGTVKERVCRMGGVAAWRESEKKKFERSHGLGEFKQEPEEDDDADCEFDSQGEELPEEEQEFRKKAKAKARQEMKDAAEVDEPEDGGKAQGKKQVWDEGGGDDDAFTIDMMLKSLNIDLNVIGYDKVAQKWVV